jgi:hypothetical protein
MNNKIFVLLFTGLTAAAQSNVYPPDTFFVGLGRSAGRDEAEAKSKAMDIARAEISKAIASKIESVSESTAEASREKNSSGVLRESIQKSYSSRLKIGTVLNNLTDVEIREQRFNPVDRTADVVAVIDRVKFVQKHGQDLRDQGKGIRAFLSQAETSKPLKKVALLKKALTLYDQYRSQIEMYRAVRRADDPTIAEMIGIERSELVAKLSAAAANIRFAVQPDGEKEIISAATSNLKKFGFELNSAATSTLILKAEIEPIPDQFMASQGMHFVRARLVVSAEEDGQAAASFELSTNESSQDERAAKIRALSALKKTIEESFVPKFLENL